MLNLKVTREMQIKTNDTVTYPLEWLKLNRLTTPSVRKNIKWSHMLLTEVQVKTTLGNRLEVFITVENMHSLQLGKSTHMFPPSGNAYICLPQYIFT